MLVRRTFDRRTGVVIAEEIVHSLPLDEQARTLDGATAKENLTVFFTWDGGRSSPVIQAVKGPKARSTYTNQTNESFNAYVNASRLLPRSSLTEKF